MLLRSGLWPVRSSVLAGKDACVCYPVSACFTASWRTRLHSSPAEVIQKSNTSPVQRSAKAECAKIAISHSFQGIQRCFALWLEVELMATHQQQVLHVFCRGFGKIRCVEVQPSIYKVSQYLRWYVWFLPCHEQFWRHGESTIIGFVSSYITTVEMLYCT